MCFVQILGKEHDKLNSRAVQYVFLGYSQSQRRLMLESVEVLICANVAFLENTPYFSASLGSTTTPSITFVTLIISLKDLSPLQVYQ